MNLLQKLSKYQVLHIIITHTQSVAPNKKGSGHKGTRRRSHDRGPIHTPSTTVTKTFQDDFMSAENIDENASNNNNGRKPPAFDDYKPISPRSDNNNRNTQAINQNNQNDQHHRHWNNESAGDESRLQINSQLHKHRDDNLNNTQNTFRTGSPSRYEIATNRSNRNELNKPETDDRAITPTRRARYELASKAEPRRDTDDQPPSQSIAESQPKRVVFADTVTTQQLTSLKSTTITNNNPVQNYNESTAPKSGLRQEEYTFAYSSINNNNPVYRSVSNWYDDEDDRSQSSEEISESLESENNLLSEKQAVTNTVIQTTEKPIEPVEEKRAEKVDLDNTADIAPEPPKVINESSEPLVSQILNDTYENEDNTDTDFLDEDIDELSTMKHLNDTSKTEVIVEKEIQIQNQQIQKQHTDISELSDDELKQSEKQEDIDSIPDVNTLDLSQTINDEDETTEDAQAKTEEDLIQDSEDELDEASEKSEPKEPKKPLQQPQKTIQPIVSDEKPVSLHAHNLGFQSTVQRSVVTSKKIIRSKSPTTARVTNVTSKKIVKPSVPEKRPKSVTRSNTPSTKPIVKSVELPVQQKEIKQEKQQRPKKPITTNISPIRSRPVSSQMNNAEFEELEHKRKIMEQKAIEKIKRNREKHEWELKQLDRAIRTEKKEADEITKELNKPKHDSAKRAGTLVRVSYIEVPPAEPDKKQSMSPPKRSKSPTIPVRPAVEHKSYSDMFNTKQEYFGRNSPTKSRVSIQTPSLVDFNFKAYEETEEDHHFDPVPQYPDFVYEDNFGSESITDEDEYAHEELTKLVEQKPIYAPVVIKQQEEPKPKPVKQHKEKKASAQIVAAPPQPHVIVEKPVDIVRKVLEQQEKKRSRPRQANVQRQESKTKSVKSSVSNTTNVTAPATPGMKRSASTSKIDRSKVDSSSDWSTGNKTKRSATPTAKKITKKQDSPQQPITVRADSPFWKRLYDQGKASKQRIEAWANNEREKREQEESAENTYVPSISENSKKILEERNNRLDNSSSQGEPIWNRLASAMLESSVLSEKENHPQVVQNNTKKAVTTSTSIDNISVYKRHNTRREKDREEYEKEKLVECTFAPQLGEKSLEIAYKQIKRGERDPNIHDTLFREAKEKNMQRKELLEEARRIQDEMDNTGVNTSRSFISKKHENKFLKRMMDANKNKELRLQNVQEQLMQEAQITFQPNTGKSSIASHQKKSGLEVSEALFERSKEYEDRKKQLEEKYENYIQQQRTSVFTNKKSEQVMKEMRKKRLHSLYNLLVLDDVHRDGMIHVANLKEKLNTLPFSLQGSLSQVVDELTLAMMEQGNGHDLVLSFFQFEQFLYDRDMDVESISQSIRLLQTELQFERVQERSSKDLQFHPQINSHSKELDRMRNTRKLISGNNDTTGLSNRFEELIAYKERRDERVKNAQEVKEQMELDKCTFEPEFISQGKKMKEIPPRATWNYRSSLNTLPSTNGE
jgi:hypothetical protein